MPQDMNQDFDLPASPGSQTTEAGETKAGWRRHPIDVRITLPGFGKRFFVTVLAGIEKRRPDRLRADRIHYPLRTRANILFFLGFAVAIYGLGGLLMILIPL